MAGEVPRVVGRAVRLAPHAIAGPLVPHVLHNVVPLAPFPNEGGAVLRHGERASSRAKEFWGDGFIAGKVTIEGTPASRKVWLFDARSAVVVAAGWSAKDGAYRFDWLDPTREYFVVAHDHVRQFNAVIADWVRPEAGDYR